MNNRLIQLDSLRGIAVLLVVGFHYTTRYEQLYTPPSPLPFALPLGSYGVHLFFIISGFVIFMTLRKTQDYKDFIVHRFARLYPAYWAAIIITSISILIFRLPGRETPPLQILINFTMLQQWFDGVNNVDGAYWTLYLELSFYTIMLAIFMLRCLDKIMPISVLWLSAMWIWWLAERFTGLQLPLVIKRSLLLDYANLFIAGMMFYLLYRAENTRKANLLLLACLAVEFLIDGLEATLICSLFFILFYLVVYKVNFINIVLSTRLLVYIGNISYCAYLLHQNIGYIILRELYAINIPPWIAIFTAAAAILLLAACVSTIVEVPAQQVIRLWWSKERNSTDNETETISTEI